jgi:purine-binding chemotaxis protein CheW
VEHIEETMRSMPVEPFPDLPSYVRGVSIVRGRPTPVVDLRTLLGDGEGGEACRLVTVKAEGDRRIALLVDAVLGIHRRESATAEALPPLLQDAGDGIVRELERLDRALLTVLEAGRLIPEDVWAGLASIREAP